MASATKLMKGMVQAMNREYGSHLVAYTKEFYGKEGTLIRMHSVRDSFFDGVKWIDDELFRSMSAAYTVMFCRDMMYALRGEAVPPAEGGWAECRAKRNVDKAIGKVVSRYGRGRTIAVQDAHGK